MAIAAAALRQLGGFNSQNLANTVWAFAKAGVAAETLFETIAAAALRQIRDFNSQGMANTVWAFATAGVAAEILFEAIGAAALRRIGEFNSQNLANFVWAFATTGFAAQELFETIAVEALRRIAEFNAQNMANTLWAFACAGWQQNQIFRELGSALMERFDELNETDKSQLYLVTLYVQMEWPDLDIPLASQVQSLRSAYTRNEPTPSQLQRDVSALLRELGWNHEFEHVTEEGISLDLADPETKRAIEVDGPFHYLKDVSSPGDYVVNGSTRFKSRLLRALGWQVTHVSFFEWDNKSRAERRQLLKNHLARIGVPHIDDDDESSPHSAGPQLR